MYVCASLCVGQEQLSTVELMHEKQTKLSSEIGELSSWHSELPGSDDLDYRAGILSNPFEPNRIFLSVRP